MTTTASAPSTVTASVEPAAPVAASNGFSISTLVLGIAGIALGQGLLSVAAIVLGFIARSKEPAARTTANWGLVLGFVGVFGGLILGIVGFAAFAPLWVAGGFGAWDFANIGLWDVWGN